MIALTVGEIINIELGKHFLAGMSGDVRKICEGEISSETLIGV